MAEQTLRAYDPTWRDKLGAYLYDHTSGSPEARQFVGGLIGSTGLGKQGPGLIDAVPGVNSTLQAQEAAQHGDAKGVAYALMPLPPAASHSAHYAGSLGKFLRDENGWIAWHGSPHKFDKFDSSKIGTGEGAQAYGHGLYFAESPGVAKDYQKKLSAGRMDINDESFDPYRDISNVNVSKAIKNGGLSEGIATARQLLETAYHPQDPRFAGVQDDLNKLLFAERGVVKPSEGHLYKVDIKPEQSQFLDWDRPLSEQHPSVQEALAKLAEESAARTNAAREARLARGTDAFGRPLKPEKLQALSQLEIPENMTGSSLYNLVQQRLGAVRPGQMDAHASQELSKMGLPGIRYLDQGSRGGGIGTSNYVVFDPAHIEVLERNGIQVGGMPPAR
jgi:hypothetical protein